LKQGWRYIDPAPFIPGWHLEAIAEHLEAVARGQITRLLINIPPRTSKSSLVSVAFPAWTWAQKGHGPLSGPHVQFLFASYAQSLSLRDSVKTRRLIESPWYQERWGDRFSLVGDQNTKQRFENDRGGYRLATSVGGALTGEGAAIICVDDAHNQLEVESDAVRQSTLDWWDESLSTRLNDSKTGAYVVIMQRLHQDDLTGHILERSDGEWVHLMLPMRFDPDRKCVTVLGFEDPREEEGEVLCPDRMGEGEVSDLERRLGPYGSAGQLQQSPTPKGGAIILRDYWKLWPSDTLPDCEFIIAALDSAYTEKEENDPSALTFWGLFRGPGGNPKVVLVYAWQGRLEINDLVTLTAALCSTVTLDEEAMERARKLLAKRGQSPREVVIPRFPVDRLLIESKASGISVAQELKRLYGGAGAFGVELVDPTRWGDKVARAYAVQPMFTDGMIYAPDREYAEIVIDQFEVFPKGKHDDLVDSGTLALRYFRLTGLAQIKEEHSREVAEEMAYRPRERALY